jgi:putative ABC transport system permease protein
MLRNYFLVACRSLKRHRFFSLINIFGLSISMSVCLGIIMLVADQMMYDRYNSKRDRIYRVVTRYLNPDGSEAGNDYATAPLPLAESLTSDYTGIEKAVRIRRGFGNGWIEFDQDVNVPLAGFYADPEALEVFEYELKYGDPKTALLEPYSVVLTEAAARKLFEQENPTGAVIKVGELGEYKVTGVIKDKDQKSHIVFEALASLSTLKSLEAAGTLSETGWDNFTSGWVYLLLEKDRAVKDIERNLDAIAAKHNAAKQDDNDQRIFGFYLQNISAVTPGPFINNAIGPFMPRVFVYFFGGLALIVMLTSCFNYTNLSIARSLTRAREIGVRKVNGANRIQIFLQFLSESVLLSLLALLGSLLLLIIVRPFLMNLKFAQVLRWDLEANVYVFGVFVLFSLVAGLMAGFFPSIVLSGFQPVKVLKNVGGIKLMSKMGLRKVLLVGQFSLSLIFIISVLLLFNQLQLFVSADHGFDMADKINVRLNQTDYAALQTELEQHSNITSVTAASHIPATGVTLGDGFKRNLSDQEGTNVDYFFVDDRYLDNMKIPLIAGRNFDPAAGASNKQFIIVNEQLVRKFQFDSPFDAVGEFLYGEADSARYEIIGIVKDYNHQVLMTEIHAMALRYNPEEFNMLHVRYAGDHGEAVKTIEAAWAKVNPSFKLDQKNFEDEVRFFYQTVFSDFVSIAGVISLMAIVISCLGLLGMATYLTETRLKEISIRKVLGSGSGALVFLLSKGFLKLLAVSILLAVPAAWFLNNLWLQLIAYRTTLSLSVLLIAISIIVILGVITIGSQTLKAAFTNPANHLRND